MRQQAESRNLRTHFFGQLCTFIYVHARAHVCGAHVAEIGGMHEAPRHPSCAYANCQVCDPAGRNKIHSGGWPNANVKANKVNLGTIKRLCGPGGFTVLLPYNTCTGLFFPKKEAAASVCNRASCQLLHWRRLLHCQSKSMFFVSRIVSRIALSFNEGLFLARQGF